MKKTAIIILTVCMLLLTGCTQVADLIRPPKDAESNVTTNVANKDKKTEEEKKPQEVEEPKTKIVISKKLNMNNDWTIMGDYSVALTKSGKDDRLILGTSARAVNGEIEWDDAQYWTLAVITDKGAYNLFYERLQGVVYAEVNEAFVKGMPTPVVVAYIFSGTERDIRLYTYNYDEDAFIEDQLFTTKAFSTGGINPLYSTFPDYKAK